MKRIMALTAAVSMLALSAHAQTQCGPRALMVETLGTKYQEEAIGGGLQGSTRILEVWRATDGSTWTILLTEASGRSCIVASGQDWVDFPSAMASMMNEYEG